MSQDRFRRLVRKKMKAKGMVQEELAEAVGISQSLLSQILSGKRNPPSTETIAKLEKVLETEPGELLTEAKRAESRMVPLLRAAGRLSKKELQQVIRSAERLAREYDREERKR